MEAHTTQGNIAQATERTPASTGTKQPTGFIPRVVIIGAGFGGLQAAKFLAHLPIKVTIIDRNNHHLFQPMLYQVATSGLSPADIASPIRETLSRQENTEVLMATVHGVDVQKQRVLLGHEQWVPYDYLIVATGATSNYFGHANIFVIGDTALAMQRGKPLPGLAPVALQEAKYVASVIEDKLQGKEHKRTFHYFNIRFFIRPNSQDSTTMLYR